MVLYTTQIDTVVLLISLDTKEKQKDKVELLKQWISSRMLASMKFDKNSNQIKLYNTGTLIGSIYTGYSNRKYYISIKFAGLKRYDEKIDIVSRECLLNICALLNTANIFFSLAELDVAIDINCEFNNILAICTKKSPNVCYNDLEDIKYFNHIPTFYLERFETRTQVDNATQRSYVYSKSAKENLDAVLTRFELKLQNRYFNRCGFSVPSILNALDKYHILFFNNQMQKKFIIEKISSYSNLQKREINRLQLDLFRLYPDSNVIKRFINEIESIYVDFYGYLAFKKTN